MTNEEFDEILERTNAVVCNREWYERAAKALEQEKYYKDLAQSYEKTIVKLTEAVAERQPCEDCVSRQAVLAIKDVPPVTPTHKKGKWIGRKKIGFGELEDVTVLVNPKGCVTDSVECSNCGNWLTGSDEYECDARYCPNCGAEMESEDKR